MISIHKQKGAQIVEFTMIALLLFAILFAIIEFSRVMYVWNTLAEVTRRTARMAVICPYNSTIPVQNALYASSSSSTLASTPIVYGLTSAMVNVSYLNQTGVTTSDQTLINFVQVTIVGFQDYLNIPLWGGTLSLTDYPFTTTLYAESLGAYPSFPSSGAAVPQTCNY